MARITVIISLIITRHRPISMKADFWNQRWEHNQIAFHQGCVNPLLDTHFDRLALNPGDRVFVPLCGKAVDMRWIADRGVSVLGVELSPVAVQDFFAEQSMLYQHREDGEFTVYESDLVSLWCGDFFSTSPETLKACHAVYDRASLIALPEDMRTRYIEHLLLTVRPEAPILLLTYEYPQAEAEGPPFSVGVEEIQRRFAGHRTVTVLESRDVLAQEAKLRSRGLTQLVEHAFLLEPEG